MAASCWTMSTNEPSFLPASCQQSATVQVRICSVVQVCGVAAPEGEMVAGDCWAFAPTVALTRARQSARRRSLLVLLAERMGTFLVSNFDFGAKLLASGAASGGSCRRGGSGRTGLPPRQCRLLLLRR